MKATAVISEAWRSITSGAARLAPAVLALALTAAGMGVMDIAAGSTILDQASAYRQSGADILVLNAPDGIDTASCERLTSLTNVQAAGAIRTTRPAHPRGPARHHHAPLPDHPRPGQTPRHQTGPEHDRADRIPTSRRNARHLHRRHDRPRRRAHRARQRHLPIPRRRTHPRIRVRAHGGKHPPPARSTPAGPRPGRKPTGPATPHGRPSPRTRKPPATMHPPSASSTPPKATASTDKPSTGNAPHASCPPAAHSSPSPSDTCSYAADGSKSPPALHCGVPKPALATQIIIETGITILLATAISLPIDMTAARLLIDTTDQDRHHPQRHTNHHHHQHRLPTRHHHHRPPHQRTTSLHLLQRTI